MRRRDAIGWGLVVLVLGLGAWTLTYDRALRTAGERSMPTSGGRTEGPVGVTPVVPVAPGREAIDRSSLPDDGIVRPAAGETEGGDGALEVLVLDALGAPAAGVPVVFERSADPYAGSTSGALARTRADGRAHIPIRHLRLVAEHPDVRWSHVVRVDLPLRESLRVELGPSFPEDGTRVTLTLPPTGSLRVAVSDELGAPLHGGARVVLTLRGGERSTIEHAQAPVLDGAAVFPYLDAGLALHVRAEWLHDIGPPVELAASGPAHAGERVELALALRSSWPVLELRAVDASGAPLAETRIDLRVTHAPWEPQRASLVTDGEGRLRLEMRCPSSVEGARRLDLLERPPGTRGASVRLADELAPEPVTELGDVVLVERAPEVLADGVVLDELGPVAGARVALLSMRDSEAHAAATDTAGRFEVLGRVLTDELWLQVSSPDHLPVHHVGMARGARDVVVHLERAARVVIELRLDDEVRAFAFRAHLRHPGWNASPVVHERLEQALAPGPLDFELETLAGLRVARFEDVQVLPDGRTEPSLRTIDLRGELRIARFQLADEDGAPIAEEDVQLQCSAGTGLARTSSEGRLDLVVPASLARLELEPLGYERLSVALGAGGVQPLRFAALDD